jgi:hypothetical protein
MTLPCNCEDGQCFYVESNTPVTPPVIKGKNYWVTLRMQSVKDMYEENARVAELSNECLESIDAQIKFRLIFSCERPISTQDVEYNVSAIVKRMITDRRLYMKAGLINVDELIACLEHDLIIKDDDIEAVFDKNQNRVIDRVIKKIKEISNK